jgi:alpha-beta hydrolase superfamily lysophospholipase
MRTWVLSSESNLPENRLNKLLRWTVTAVISIAALWLIVALALVFSPSPTFSKKPLMLSSETLAEARAAQGCDESAGVRCFRMRDGAVLSARWHNSASDTTILLLHGVMSDSAELEKTALLLQQATGANVVNLDLRGHGRSAGRFGDVDYIGQYEDDLADVVAAIRKSEPGNRLILAGHSMGGGIVTRYAARRTMPEVDGYLLFAPHLGQKSPTTPTEAPVVKGPADEPPIKFDLRRTIGLLMLNLIGVRAFNHMDTLYFNVSDGSRLLCYSFAAMASVAPDDYASALRADDKPLLIIAGQNDEAFHTDRYPEVVKLHRNGQALIIPGETHDGVIRNPVAFAAIKKWLRTTN